ncbi:F-box/kelch-repeat protein [Anopheles sinensis]|uniref:F-box/kelch-repeat protein n=1 Tax=Anopheles sinensis TaxID=74873 RepID=A0A084WTX0_ANOSI|nr:F-box/kelch-repeat protein [Anopheles sinensis]
MDGRYCSVLPFSLPNSPSLNQSKRHPNCRELPPIARIQATFRQVIVRKELYAQRS